MSTLPLMTIPFCYRKLKDQKKIFYSGFPSFYAAVKHERERRASSSLVLPSSLMNDTTLTLELERVGPMLGYKKEELPDLFEEFDKTGGCAAFEFVKLLVSARFIHILNVLSISYNGKIYFVKNRYGASGLYPFENQMTEWKEKV